MIASYQRTNGDSPQFTHDIVRNGWIIAADPTADELDKLSVELGVARDLLQDARDPNEVPRIQTEEGIVYVYLRIPETRGERMFTVPVLLAMGKDFLLTVWGNEPTFVEHFLNGQVPYSTERRSQLLLRLLAQINEMYQGALAEIGKLVRATMADLGKVENEDILRLVTFEGVLNDFLATLIPMHNNLGQMVAGKHIKTYEEDEDLYEDVLLQSGQLM